MFYDSVCTLYVLILHLHLSNTAHRHVAVTCRSRAAENCPRWNRDEKICWGVSTQVMNGGWPKGSCRSRRIYSPVARWVVWSAFSVTTSAISRDWLKQFLTISTRRPEVFDDWRGLILRGFRSATIWKTTNDLRSADCKGVGRKRSGPKLTVSMGFGKIQWVLVEKRGS